MPIVSRQMDERVLSAFMAMSRAYTDHFHRVNLAITPMSTVTETLEMTVEDARSWPPFVEYLHPLGIRDVTGLHARDPTGCSIGFTAPCPDARRPTRREVDTWSRI